MVEQLVGRRALLSLGLGSVACGLIPEPKGFVKMKAKGPGDKEAKVIYERHFEGWSEMFDTMNEAAGVSAATTGKMVEVLTAVPPPGHVTLGDLSPALLAQAGGQADFIAKASKDEPDKFRYVRLGVPGFDKFFQSAAELYAFVYQARELLVSLHGKISATVEASAEATAKLSEKVDGTLATASADAKVELEGFRDVAIQIAGLASGFYTRVTELVTASQMLIADATNLLAAPKLVAHVDLVVQGVKDSVGMVTASGKLLGEATGELVGFG
jgi:hypothetical protein